MNSIETIYIDECFARLEHPDTVFIAYVGHIHGKHTQGINDAIARFANGKRYILILCDLTNTKSITAEARRTASLSLRLSNVRGIGVIGATFQNRVIATLVYKVLRLLNRDVDNPLAFINNEEDGWAWIETRRKELAEPAS